MGKNIIKKYFRRVKEYNFKIKIIKSNSKRIMVGITQITPDFLDEDCFKILSNLKGKNSNNYVYGQKNSPITTTRIFLLSLFAVAFVSFSGKLEIICIP